MDQIFISDLRARGVIGISDRERANPQDIIINITLFTDTTLPARTDRIEDCRDYSILAKKVLAHAESAGRFTVEALAGDLAALCLEDPAVAGVRVRVEKPGAVRFTRSVGVEIERYQPDIGLKR